MKTVVIVLTVIAIALGAGGGYVAGFTWALIETVRTDVQLGCAVLQTAESAGYITREQRGKLVDTVVPPLPKDIVVDKDMDWIRAFSMGWWDSIREDLKSGCRGVAAPAPEGQA